MKHCGLFAFPRDKHTQVRIGLMQKALCSDYSDKWN